MLKKEKLVDVVFIFSACVVLVFSLVCGFVKTKYDRFYINEIEEFSEEFNISPELVLGVVYAESSFNSDAESTAGAVGLMQILPSTALWIAQMLNEKDFNTEQLKTPNINIRFGCFYLNYLFQKFEDEEVVLFCYNIGEGVYLEETKTKSFNEIKNEYPRVNKYIKRVKHAKKMYEILY